MPTTPTNSPRKTNERTSAHYVGVAGVAEWLGVESATVTKWLTRYHDTPEPDAYIPPGRNGTPDRGWLPERRSDWETWRQSRPGQGAPGRPKPRRAGASPSSAAPTSGDGSPATPKGHEDGGQVTATQFSDQEAPTPASKAPGRPRRRIDLAEVASAVDELWSEGGLDNVSVAAVGDRLSIPRATLYRTISTQDQLLTICFEQMSHANAEAALKVMKRSTDPAERLYGMMELAIDTGLRNRSRSSLFYMLAGMPTKKYMASRRKWEQAWLEVAADAIGAGLIQGDDPRIASRMIMGMCISTAYWWGPSSEATSGRIMAEAIKLITSGSD